MSFSFAIDKQSCCIIGLIFQTVTGSRIMSCGASRSGSACGVRRGGSGSNVNLRPSSSQPWGCPRANCTACCPPPRLPKCPLGVYVERAVSWKPASTYVPSDAKFAGLTTYKEFYVPKCGERTLSFKPASKFDPSDAKLSGLTTYKENYTPKCGGRTVSFKPAVTFDPSDAPFAGISTYRNDYYGKCGELVKV